jgi:hypothetical protein
VLIAWRGTAYSGASVLIQGGPRQIRHLGLDVNQTCLSFDGARRCRHGI